MRILIIICISLAAIMPARAQGNTQGDIPQIEWKTSYASWVAALELERRCATLYLYEAREIHRLIAESEKTLPTWYKAHGTNRSTPREMELHTEEVAAQRKTAIDAVSSFTCEQANASMLTSARSIISNRLLKDLLLSEYVFNGTVSDITLKPTEKQVELRNRLVQVLGGIYGEGWQAAKDNAEQEMNKELEAQMPQYQRSVVIDAYRRVEDALQQLLVELAVLQAGHRIDVNVNDASLYAIAPSEGDGMVTVAPVDMLKLHTNGKRYVLVPGLKGIDEAGRLVIMMFDDGQKTKELDALSAARLLVQDAALTGATYKDNWRSMTTSHEGTPLANCPATACYAFPAEATQKIARHRIEYDINGYSYNAEYYLGTAEAFPILMDDGGDRLGREHLDIEVIDYWIARQETAGQ
ncbi:hypothetical protein FF098_010055 [Parvularcula flava]|uniref:Uncharacterized protein n=1 Tax=Aquisalinus luteolus TaxID=1566827 RepID=A0A8J3A822_9PROT|nr:hypothetical protein [Aquisalinus luteolus]NHK28247.1 hypothetical protein [Aquisalinus luteolus]GGH97906.1 hypothetical protein GCM10011355_20240 [Aquisalinus luteolus]